MVGDLRLTKAGPSACRFVNGPSTHLWRMRSERSSIDGVMGVVVSALSFQERDSGQNYKYQDAQEDKNQRWGKKKRKERRKEGGWEGGREGRKGKGKALIKLERWTGGEVVKSMYYSCIAPEFRLRPPVTSTPCTLMPLLASGALTCTHTDTQTYIYTIF